MSAVGDDAFQASHIVAEIAAVIDQHEEGKPANIALYGPWGSGKSSIAKLLENEFDPEHQQNLRGHPSPTSTSTCFIRFDAFKYAGHSLHRNFLLKVAEGLASTGNVSDQLYGSVTARRLELSPRGVLRLIGQVLLLVVAPTIIAAFLGALAWGTWFSDLAVLDGARRVLPETLALMVVPAAAGLFALLREILPVSVVTASPSSEEQFEAQFTELVRESNVDRVVIFVDEIDRCAPTEVVDTLDTVRTFLDVAKVVVIVAADQRVLEGALTVKVRQTTPEDTTNPYYSAGSAYLDKVFHYQFSIPPLLPAVISSYALSLVSDKGGVWAAIDLEEVISVLIPTHVRSPRRVKALLNNYVLSYRLAFDRDVGFTGKTTLADRAAELAVLVCLRSEFPLFARDLPQHPALPSLIRWRIRNDDSDGDDGTPDRGRFVEPPADPKPRATARSWELANAYFEKVVPAATTFSEVDVDHRPAGQPPSPALVGAIRDDLVGYLSKTAYVPPPATDLLYLVDSSGFFGLDVDQAEELAAFAHNVELTPLRRAIRQLDADGQRNALRFLAHRTREEAFGQDGANMASSLLAAAEAATTESLDSTVRDVVLAVRQQQKRNRLRSSDLSGALRVGLRSQLGAAHELVQAVMRRGEFAEDAALAVTVLSSATELIDEYPSELGEALGWAVIHDPEAVVEQLAAMSDADRTALMRIAGVHAQDVLEAALERDDSNENDPSEAGEPHPVVASSALVLKGLLSQPDRLAGEHFVAALLGNDGLTATAQVVVAQIDGMSPARTSELASAAIVAATNRDWREMAMWVQVATTDAWTPSDRRRATADLIRRLWSERSESGDDAEAFNSAVAALQRLSNGMDDDREELTQSLLSDAIEVPVPDPATVQQAGAEFEKLRRFAEHDLFHFQSAANVVVAGVRQALRGSVPVQRRGLEPSVTEQAEWARHWGMWAAHHADTALARELVEAARESSWLPSPLVENFVVEASNAADLERPYEPDQLASLVGEHPDDTLVRETLESWFETWASPDDVWAVAKPHLRGGLPGALDAAMQHWAAQSSPEDRAAAALPALDVLPHSRPHSGYLAALDAKSADHGVLANRLVARCDQASLWNETKRYNVLSTWRDLHIDEPAARATLLRGVLLEFLRSNKAAVELLRFRELLHEPPAGLREELLEAFEKYPGGKQRAPAVRQMLTETGIRSKGLLGQVTDRAKKQIFPRRSD